MSLPISTTTITYDGWRLSARSVSAIPSAKGLHLLRTAGTRVVVALAPMGSTDRLPDSFSQYAYLSDAQFFARSASSFGPSAIQIPNEPPPPGSAWEDVVVARLGNGTEWAVRAGSQIAKFSGLDPLESYYVYVWVEKSYESVSTVMPLIDVVDWLPSHSLSAQIVAHSKLTAQIKVAGAIYLSAAVVARSVAFVARGLSAAIVARTAAVAGATSWVELRDTQHFLSANIFATSAALAVAKAGTAWGLSASALARSRALAGLPVVYSVDSAASVSVRGRLQPMTGRWSDLMVFALVAELPRVEGALQLTEVPVDITLQGGVSGLIAALQSAGVWLWEGVDMRLDGALAPVTGRMSDTLIFDVDAAMPPVAGRWAQDVGVLLAAEAPRFLDQWSLTRRVLETFPATAALLDRLTFIVRSDKLVPQSQWSTQDSYAYSGAYATDELSAASVADLWSFRSADVVDTGAKVWAVNTETMATSEYTNYGFNSFFVRDGVYYGVAEDGIYRLDSDTDAGAPIEAILDTGVQDFNIARNKYLPHIYVGVQSPQPVLADVSADGVVRSYSAPINSTTLDVVRVGCGKGVKANYWGVTIRNQYGAMIEIDSVRLAPILTIRRM